MGDPPTGRIARRLQPDDRNFLIIILLVIIVGLGLLVLVNNSGFFGKYYKKELKKGFSAPFSKKYPVARKQLNRLVDDYNKKLTDGSELRIFVDDVSEQFDKVTIKAHWEKHYIKLSDYPGDGRAELIFSVRGKEAKLVEIQGDSPFDDEKATKQ